MGTGANGSSKNSMQGTPTLQQRTSLHGASLAKIFKTSQDQKIELLYKHFSDNNGQGITFNNFLKMLYNYPKEDLKIILNDQEFINKQIRRSLVGLDKELNGRRLQSLNPTDLKNIAVDGKAFRLAESDTFSQLYESKYYGDRVMKELDKKQSQRRTTWKIAIGQNDVEVKTTSIHHLVKKYARSIFKHYGISQLTGRFRYDNFRDWILHHKNLYNVYYEGFHCQAWQVNTGTDSPVYCTKPPQFCSKARLVTNGQMLNTFISLIHSIIIVCEQGKEKDPIFLICLEGLAVNDMFDHEKGYGFEISHREGVYPAKKFYFLNQQLQKQWMSYLKFYKGNSVTQFYETNQKIGTGKFSIVYNCRQKSTNQEYAIKVIQAFKLDKAAKKLLAHESNIMSVMSHPLLVFFKQSITTKTHIYIITELVRGKDLFDLVKDLKYLEEPEVMYIVEQIIIGVQYIHSLDIVHRDLKPENIMVEYDEKQNKIGRVKIIDFGFANYISNLRELPKDELWAGTPNYIAPEILKQEDFDQKIDNFAIGSILYFLLSGTLPFNSQDTGVILHRTVEGSYTLSGKKWERISEEAKDLVSKLLEGEPSERITLEDALRHPWFQKTRKSRENLTSMRLLKTPEERLKRMQNNGKGETNKANGPNGTANGEKQLIY